MHTLGDNIGILDWETRSSLGFVRVVVLYIREILDEIVVLVYHLTRNRGTLWMEHVHSSQLCHRPR